MVRLARALLGASEVRRGRECGFFGFGRKVITFILLLISLLLSLFLQLSKNMNCHFKVETFPDVPIS